MEQDTTLLSASTIGSPAAFSTAVKPPWTLSTHPSSDSSLLTQDILAQLPHDHSQINSADVTGRLSLDSVGSVHEKQDPLSQGIGTDNATTLDDTSLGVLDLETMQDSSMTKFLTSPRISQELHLHVTSTRSVQAFATASAEPSGASTLQGSAQARGSVRLHERGKIEGRSIPAEPPHPQVEDHEEEDGGEEGGGIPAELLERASTVCSSVGYSSSEWEEEEREELAKQQQSGLQSQSGQGEHPPAPPPESGERREHPTSSVLPLARPRGDGHENEAASHSIPTLQNGLEPLQPQACETVSLPPYRSEHHTLSAPPSSSLQHSHHHIPVSISASLHGSKHVGVQQPEEPPSEHVPAVRFEVDTVLQGLEGGEEVVHPPGSEEEDLVNMTLIGDEVEPTVMGEADEFSQFEPTHLASMLNRDSLLTVRPPVTAGQESSPKQPASTTPTTTTAAQPQVPLSASVAATFPASVDRNDVLHGDLKMSEQVRPVAEGFTDRDEHSGDRLVESSSQKSDGLAGKGKLSEMQPIASEGYFSTGQASEMSIGDPHIGRHDTGISLSSGGPATSSSRQLVVGEGGGGGEEEDEGGSPFEVVDATTTMEGLPSALLAVTSFCDTGLDDTGLPGGSLSSHSSLASSLTELAGALGSKPTEAGEEAVTRNGAPETESNARASQSGAVYNPFDSDDNASVGSFGQLEFEQSSDSFIAQLAKDEVEVQKANLFTHTLTPSFQSMSQNLTASWSHLTDAGGEEVSIGSYFVKQSHPLGALPSTRLAPSDRPKFSDSDSHIIQSPPELLVPAPPTSDGSSPALQAQDASNDADRTIVEEPEEDAASKPAQERAIVTSSVSQTETQEANLTPVITVHTPFPVQFEIPKLDLEDVTVSTPGSFNPLRVSTTVKLAASHTQKPILHTSTSLQPDVSKESLPKCVTSSGPSTSSVVTSTAVTTSKATPTITASLDLESGPSPAGTEPRLSTGLEPGRTSQSWKPTGSSDTTASTLIFPELSALTLSPPLAGLGSLDSMPTPSIARLSAGFDVTEATIHDTSFSTSLGLTKKEVSGTKASQSPPELTGDQKPGTKQAVIPGTQSATQVQKHAPLTQTPEPRPPALSDPVLQPHSPTKSQSAANSSGKEISSPKTVAARQKLAQLQATLEATRFDAENFLAKLKSTTSPGSPLRLATSEHNVGDSPTVSKSLDYLASSTTPHKATGSLQVGTGDTSLPVSYTLMVTSIDKTSSLPSLCTSKDGLRYSFSMTCTPESHSFLQQPAALPQEAKPTYVGTQVAEESSAEEGSSAGKRQLGTYEHALSQDSHEETHLESPLPPPPSSGGDAKPHLVISPPAITVAVLSTEHIPSLEEQQTSTSKSQGEGKPLPQAAARKEVPSKSTVATVVSSESTRHVYVSSPKSPKHSEPSSKHTPLQKSPKELAPPSSKGKGYSTAQTSQGHEATESSVQTSLSHDILNRKVQSTTKAPSFPLSSSDSVLEASWRRSKKKEESHGSKPGVSSPQHKFKASPKKTRTGAQVTTVTSTTTTVSSTTVTSTTTTSEIQLSPKHTLPSKSPHTVNPPSLHTPSSPLRQGTSPPGKPIYTSPPTHLHTTHSPSKHRAKGSTRIPDAGSLHVPDSLCFNAVCCVGTSLSDQLLVANSGDRWLQLSFEVCELYVEGAECTSEEHNIFSVPQRCYVGPHKSEAVKVVFTPHSAGSYEAVLQVQAQLVGMERDGSLTSRVILKALAEKPKLEVVTGGHGPPGLDYGVLVGGSSVSLPLQLTNHGLAELPLQLSILATTLSQICFSFGEIPTPLLPSSPPSHLYTPPHTLSITLPPKPQKQAKPVPHTIDVCFRAPRKYIDNSSAPGPPDEISASVDIAVGGASTVDTLCSLPVRAIVGVARLHVPRLLQAISLSCTAGQLVSREVPFKNAGNIPLRVRLRTSPDSAHFTIAPDFLLMEPNEEAQVSVCFAPPSAPLTSEGSLMIHVEPSGPNYEMKLRGTAAEDERHRDGLLSCSKRSLYWGGVELNNSCPQKLVLHNSFQYKVLLRLSIRHHNSPFQLQTIDGATLSVHTQEVDILPQEQLPLYIIYTPKSDGVHCSALDIYDTAHSKKYRIPMCGFGGVSQVEVMNARRSTSGSWIDMGEVVAGQCCAVKVSLFNSGQRPAFIQALCYPGFGTIDDSSTPLSVDLASVTPSELILQPQHVKEVLLVYRASEADEGQCLSFPSPLARLVLFTGEEMLRQRLQRSFGGDRRVQLTNSFNKQFLKHFPEQESVPSELDFSSFEVEDEEKFFEQQLRRVVISLSGSPQTESPLPQPSHPPPQSPPHPTHTLSPSYTPGTEDKGTDLTHSPPSRILSCHTLTLPDTPVGHYSEKFLAICNPFSQPLRWHLSSVASPFVREISGGQSDICKATYSAFWVHERRGTILPHTSAEVLVTFQPHNQGSFSQIWDLQVSTDETGPKKLRISFGGKAIAVPLHRQAVEDTHTPQSEPVIQTLSLASQPSSTTMSKVYAASSVVQSTGSAGAAAFVPPTSRVSPQRKNVYIREESINFPLTNVGNKSTIKARVCNKDSLRHKFEVIKPTLPFLVDHHIFELGTRQCARLPVHFMPTAPGEYKGILAIKTTAGHQAFAVLRASSCP